ncbi:MAG: hypothetical protein H6724_07490 [Sandaracinus sp.]|nr:hypothetical protein [Sandaracinus sp.]MCB9619280.1 hypothetical protein [Sandaracinus sp.]
MKIRSISLLLVALAWGCGDDDGTIEPDASTPVDAAMADSGTPDAGGEDAGDEDAGCIDSDLDGTCDEDDVCLNGPDSEDADSDGVPDACDLCAGEDDGMDGDADGLPDGCDCDASASRCVENATCEDGASGVTCTCDEGFSGDGTTACAAVDCGALEAPTNGSVDAATTTFGSTATYDCGSGFTLAGDPTRTCEASGVWSGSAPICSSVDCGTLGAPTNGTVNVPSTGFSSVAEYACNTGYLLEGSAMRTCQMSGSWSGAAPTCRLVDCGTLPPPVEGTVMTDRTTLGGTATYACNPGWMSMSPLTRTCQSSGAWSGSAPSCGPVDCGTLTAPANGNVGAASTTFGSLAVYSCNDGFTLVGSNMRECQSNGTWSGTSPTCAADVANCGAPPTATGATISTTMGNMEGSVATYSCGRGRRLLGGNRAICTAAGTWLGEPAECASIMTCACSSTFVDGERIRAVNAAPSGATGVAAGTLGRVDAATSNFEGRVLAEWDGWTGGHSGICTTATCGSCSTGGSNSWWTLCPDVESARLTCGCGGQFSPGDRVVALYDNPSGARNVLQGRRGTVVAGGTSTLPVLIQWDRWTDGHNGNCGASQCGTCTASATNNRWYTACELLGRAP